MKKKLACVLLVDDDSVTNFLNAKVIEQAKVAEHIEVKLNGQEALDFLTPQDTTAGDPPCLILLDLNMPIMDGWDFLEAYKEKVAKQNSKTNIILLSASSNPDDIKRASQIPIVSAYRTKPLTTELLEEIIQDYFEEYL